MTFLYCLCISGIKSNNIRWISDHIYILCCSAKTAEAVRALDSDYFSRKLDYITTLESIPYSATRSISSSRD